MTTAKTPSCIEESIPKTVIEVFGMPTREEASERIKKAVAACDQHKIQATLRALKLVSEIRRRESQT